MFKKIPFIHLTEDEKKIIKDIEKTKEEYIIIFQNEETKNFKRKGFVDSFKEFFKNYNLKNDEKEKPKKEKKKKIKVEEVPLNFGSIQDTEINSNLNREYENIECGIYMDNSQNILSYFNQIENFNILKNLIENEKVENDNTEFKIKKEVYEIKDNHLTSIRVSKNLKEKITKYSKKHKIKLQDLFNQIINDFLKSN